MTDEQMTTPHLRGPSGNRKGYSFRMTTPPELVGKPVPGAPGKTFGREIVRGLNTRYQREAVKRCRIWTGIVERWAAECREATTDSHDGEAWGPPKVMLPGEARRLLDDTREAHGEDSEEYAIVYATVEDEVERIEQWRAQPDERGEVTPTAKQSGKAERYASKARGLHTLQSAREAYLKDDEEGAGRTLGRSAREGLRLAVERLESALGPGVFLPDVTREQANSFINTHLAKMTTAKAPKGLSVAAIKKDLSLLKGLWRWAVDSEVVAWDGNVWEQVTVRPRTGRRTDDEKVEPFDAEDWIRLCQALRAKDNTLSDLMWLGPHYTTVIE